MKVSIIISNRNDLEMLTVTVRSCLEELRPLGPGNGEIVICDNSDEEIYKKLPSVLPIGYIEEGLLSVYRQSFPCLFTARETAASKAEGEYIICLDSHMIVGRDMILDLVNFMDSKKDDPTVGFAHAPINWAHQHDRNARHDRDMSENELGPWGTAYNYERTISWKGMPWICRRSWFLDKRAGLGGYGALSEYKLSWGGGDMHIGVKPWLLGFRNWAVPTSPASHIGPFPGIDKVDNSSTVNVADASNPNRYRKWSVSGSGPSAIGFLVSCYVLGGDQMMKRNAPAIQERFGGLIDITKWWFKARIYGRNEKAWLDKRKVITFEELLKTKPWEQDDRQEDLRSVAV